MNRNTSFVVQVKSLTMLVWLLPAGLSLLAHAAPGEDPWEGPLLDMLAADPLFTDQISKDIFLGSMCLLADDALLATLEDKKSDCERWGWVPDKKLAIIEVCFADELTTQARTSLISEKYQAWVGSEHASNGGKDEHRIPSLISSLAHLGSKTALEALVVLAKAGNTEALDARARTVAQHYSAARGCDRTWYPCARIPRRNDRRRTPGAGIRGCADRAPLISLNKGSLRFSGFLNPISEDV